MILAFLTHVAVATQMTAQAEQALRLRIGALPALWKLEADVEALQGYLQKPREMLLQLENEIKKGPDCECINKNQKGPDCECINKEPVVLAKADAKKGPDCECINNKQQGGAGCPFCGSEGHGTVNNKTQDAPVVDQETTDLLKQAKNVKVSDMPMMLTILEAMYDRFKQNIVSANKLEAKTKKHYEENMAEYAKKEKERKGKKDEAMERMHTYWEKSRKLSHQHYRSMLKVAHAGMARLQMAIDMMSKAVKGDKLDKKELDALKAATPPPNVVFAQVRTSLLEFCKGAIADLEAAKKAGKEAEPAPLAFLQVRRSEPAPEDQLAKEMTHDLEMNFNKIAPFGKEDTAKELQDHAAKTQDTLVDAVENAEVAEIKRAVFRALTRLRAATIKEFDTIARLETQAIDAYNDAHHYRAENPLSHLHEDEAPVETDKLKSFH